MLCIKSAFLFHWKVIYSHNIMSKLLHFPMKQKANDLKA